MNSRTPSNVNSNISKKGQDGVLWLFVLFRSPLPSSALKATFGLNGKYRSRRCQHQHHHLLWCRCNSLTCLWFEAHWTPKQHGSHRTLCLCSIRNVNGGVKEWPIYIMCVSSLLACTLHCPIKLHLQNISSKISKNWWQLSNQVWGPSECKSLWAAWVTHPRSLICFLGFCLYHWLHLLNLSHWL